MEKYGNKSPFMRFVHKNTGFIICGVFIAIAISAYFYIVGQQEFFETWTCGNLEWYALTYNQEVSDWGFPDHNHLSEKQHDKFHEIVAECNFIFDHE